MGKTPDGPAKLSGLQFRAVIRNNTLQAGKPASAPIQRKPDPRWRILVVEDDADILRLNAGILRRSGYRADAAENGAVAWKALQHERYDLLVTDHKMPKLSGVDLLKKLHAAGMALPVLMVTGNFPAWEFTLHPSLQPAATLLKPYTFEELLGKVREVLRATGSVLGKNALPPDWQSQPPAMGLQS
jgi:DNA-binding response OmpR family regulator